MFPFWEDDKALGHYYMTFLDFPNICKYSKILTFKRQSHKMVKHTQTILWNWYLKC